MLNVRVNAYKRGCWHNVGFPSKGRSDFPCVVFVCLTLVWSKCMCVCVCLSRPVLRGVAAM